MTVLTIIGILMGVAGIGWACVTVNDYAEREYAYSVFNIPNLLLMFIPIGLFLLSIFFVPNDEAYVPALMAGNLDIIVLLVLSAASLIGFVTYLAHQTNIWIAVFVVVVLFLAAVIILAILLLVAALSGKEKKEQ